MLVQDAESIRVEVEEEGREGPLTRWSRLLVLTPGSVILHAHLAFEVIMEVLHLLK